MAHLKITGTLPKYTPPPTLSYRSSLQNFLMLYFELATPKLGTLLLILMPVSLSASTERSSFFIILSSVTEDMSHSTL